MNLSVSHNMYFIAILCPPELDKKINRYKLWMKEQFGCSVALKSPAHITLVPPFWLQVDKEPELIEVFHLFSSDITDLKITLKGFGHFNKKVLFVAVEQNPGLEELKFQTQNYFIRNTGDAIKKDDRPFHPHVTIAS